MKGTRQRAEKSTAILRGRVRRALVVLIAAVIPAVFFLGAQALARGDEGAAATREITLVAEDFTFNAGNPVLELQAGEKVALTIENHEADVLHDFTIAGLGVHTDGYIEPGSHQTIEFTPDRTGTFHYGCTLHPGLMDGQIRVN